MLCAVIFVAALPLCATEARQRQAVANVAEAKQLMATYCFDCHDAGTKEGNLDLAGLLDKDDFDGHIVFENLLTERMPPEEVEQPTAQERRLILNWLARRQVEKAPRSYRRISRREFVHSVNDLLGTDYDVVSMIPQDRGTNNFDSDRRILLTREMLAAYFLAADELLEFAFPESGFPQERIWTTNQVRDSHHTYSSYARKYKDGMLFSWTRANNGNSYSFFYDDFEPPVEGLVRTDV